MTEPETFTIDSPDGLPIRCRRWLPSGAPTATIQIAHGMAEHIGRYAPLADELVARGYAVYGNDHRGHGGSVPEGEEPGHMGENGFDRSVEVVHRLAQRVAKEHPGVKHVLFGHSMGSFMVQRILYTHPDDADAAVLSGSNGKPPPIAAAGRLVARLERMRLGARGKSKILDALSFGDFNKKFAPNRTGFDWISSDPAQVDIYIDDPMCGFVCSTQSWIDLLDALPTLTAKENVARIPKTMPIYVFSGSADPVGDSGRGVTKLVDAYRAAGLRNVDVKLYEGGRHEMLHEKNADEVVRDLLAWIERAVAS